MNKQPWPKDPEKRIDLEEAFLEGEYQHQRAQDAYAIAIAALYEARNKGNKTDITNCKANLEEARQAMNRLRYAPVKPN